METVQCVETVQQRVHAMAEELMAGHPGCPAAGLVLVSWRPVFLRTLYGTGVIQVPTFRCAGVVGRGVYNPA